MKYLEELLAKDMGLSYDPHNKKHHKDTNKNTFLMMFLIVMI